MSVATQKVVELLERPELGRHAAKKVRQKGRVPVNLYGAGMPAQSLSISLDDMLSILKEKRKVLLLGLPDGTKGYAVFQQIDWDATLDNILHVDLLRAVETTRLVVPVSVTLEGLPKGVAKGGNFKQELWELRIRITPDAIPDTLPHDLSDLDLGGSLTAGEFSLPESAELVTDPDAVVARVMALESSRPEEGSEEEAAADASSGEEPVAEES